jgi:hypothetical protein
MMTNPEIAELVLAGGFRTNVHDVGSGPPVLLIQHAGRFAERAGRFLAEAGADEPRPLEA